jgi:hypothetical protein
MIDIDINIYILNKPNITFTIIRFIPPYLRASIIFNKTLYKISLIFNKKEKKYYMGYQFKYILIPF